VPTFPRGHHAFQARLQNAQRIAKLAKEGKPIERHVQRGFEFADPVDLRGLPAVGRGCGGGAIRGTRPGDGLFR
jgi:hypothetical protein